MRCITCLKVCDERVKLSVGSVGRACGEDVPVLHKSGLNQGQEVFDGVRGWQTVPLPQLITTMRNGLEMKFGANARLTCW
jgi:hypothetical protein